MNQLGRAARRNKFSARHNVRGTHPAGDMVLHSGDVLVLLGKEMALLAAEKRLREG